jgi:hypothetical protein
MIDIFFSSPLIVLYVLCVGGLLVAALWPGRPDPRGREECVRWPEKWGDDDPSFPARRLTWDTGGRELFPVRKLNASCSEEYSAQFAAAIKQVRKE